MPMSVSSSLIFDQRSRRLRRNPSRFLSVSPILHGYLSPTLFRQFFTVSFLFR
ncbi:predicted protein [Arabidopsis lyrata subsp. lyrata]|uniref:Predicted protein n=1 Tax=Arabidopsis lyrata subsp. lyrata TaxID=81972 RepID=D7LPT9_ARALL|nr:predicted protein [Arabidopsis lyrata subsp. lyrata]